MNEKRIEWIDVARGITIILMVIGHTRLPEIMAKWIWSFHMPFFFLIAGFTLTTTKYLSFFAYLKHKIRTFLIPFFVFSLINLLLSLYYKDNSFSVYYLKVLKYGWDGIALWFIPVLFLSEVVFFFFAKLRNNYLKILMIIFLSVAGWLFYIKGIILPWALSTVFIGSAFICIGSYIKEITYKLVYESKKLYVICIICFLGGLIISYFWRLDLFTNKISPLLPLMIGALSGFYFMVIISYYLSEKTKNLSNIFSYFGKNAFIIMAFSQTLMLCIIKVFGKTIAGSLLLSTLMRQCLLWIALILVIQLINTLFPWMLGRNKYEK